MKIKCHNSFMYVTVHAILEWRDGCPFKTKVVGYAHRDRVKGKDEMYSSISTKLTDPRLHPTGEVTLEPFLE